MTFLVVAIYGVDKNYKKALVFLTIKYRTKIKYIMILI